MTQFTWTVTDTSLKVWHNPTGMTLIRFGFFTVKSIQINKVLGQLGTSKKYSKALKYYIQFNRHITESGALFCICSVIQEGGCSSTLHELTLLLLESYCHWPCNFSILKFHPSKPKISKLLFQINIISDISKLFQISKSTK